MVNEDIVTALENAVHNGESIETAVRIAINSGYNPGEVHEASKYVGAGVIKELEIRPEEQLMMPAEKKKGFSLFRRKPKQKQLDSQKSLKKEAKFIKKEIVPEKIEKLKRKEVIEEPPIPLSKPPSKKKGWMKEIILLILLLLLIGILIGSILFRNKILAFFSG